MYIGDTAVARAAPPGLRSRRQLDRRGHGRLRQEHLRHDQRRRLGHRRGRRPRHPRRNAPRPGLLHAGRRDDRAQVRRQVREGRLSNLRRPARRGRHGGELPLRMVRGRSPPRRPRLSAGVRARRAHRRRPHASAPPTKTGTKTTFKPDPQIFPTPSSSTTRCTAACRSWRSSTAA